MLQEFGIEYEMTIASAHRTPKKVLEYTQTAEKRGLKVLIAGAGWAAHLAGVVASHTTLPVIGVPIDSSPLKGIDALLSTAQMPGGVPVATMSLGKAGAKNAGVFAAQILAINDVKVANRIKVFKVEMERDVEEKSKRLAALSSSVVPVKEAVPAEHEAPAKKKSRRRRWKKKPTGSGTSQEPAS
jgi:phosphoribosylaminoimidazole carboxylase PurE protein